MGYAIAEMVKNKRSLLLHSRNAFGEVKDELFNILDAIRDVYLGVESGEARIASRMKMMRRYLDKRAVWKYQHKYSTKTTRACVDAATKVTGLMKKVDKHYEDLERLVTKMAAVHKGGLEAAVKETDCSTFETPTPEPVDDTTTDPYEQDLLELWGSDDTTDVDVDETAEERMERLMREWRRKERMRKADLKKCHARLEHLKAQLAAVSPAFKAVIGKFDVELPTTPFPAKLQARITAYDKAAKAAVKAGGDMVGTEQKDAQALNTLARKTALQHEQDAKDYGAANQALKMKMI